MKKSSLIAMLLVCLALLLGGGFASAQTADLQLLLSRDMGFALGSQIQGSFSLGVTGPTDIGSVTFSIDGREMATVTHSPFRYAFSTDSYALGRHQFMATARTSGGQALKSNTIDVEIVSPSAGMQATSRIAIPIVAVVFVILVATFAIQFLPRRRNPHGGYGIAGGAICPKCGRPFARSFFGMNLLGGKLERCPHCGKWSVTHRASSEALQAAEAANQPAAPAAPGLSAEELLRRQIEDSRLSK